MSEHDVGAVVAYVRKKSAEVGSGESGGTSQTSSDNDAPANGVSRKKHALEFKHSLPTFHMLNIRTPQTNYRLRSKEGKGKRSRVTKEPAIGNEVGTFSFAPTGSGILRRACPNRCDLDSFVGDRIVYWSRQKKGAPVKEKRTSTNRPKKGEPQE